MSDDLSVKIDNKQAIEQLQALGKSVDTLEGKLKSLNASNLKSMRKEFESLKTSPLESMRELAAQLTSMTDGIANNKYFKGLSSGMMNSIRMALAQVRTEMGNELAKLETELADKTNFHRRISAQVAQAFDQAKSSKSVYTDLNSQVAKNLQAGSRRSLLAAAEQEKKDNASRLATWEAMEAESARVRKSQVNAAYDQMKDKGVQTAQQVWAAKDAINKAEKKALGDRVAGEIKAFNEQIDSTEALRKAHANSVKQRGEALKASQELNRKAIVASLDQEKSDAKARNSAWDQIDSEAQKKKQKQMDAAWGSLKDKDMQTSAQIFKAKEDRDKAEANALKRRVNEEIKAHNEELDRIAAQTKARQKAAQEAQKLAATDPRAGAKNMVAAATNDPVGNFQRYNPRTGLAGAVVEVEKADGKLMSLTKTMALFGKETNYTHSLVRGLASGLNLLWLTWGATLPLAAGAAISYTMREVVKEGMAVETELTKMLALGGETEQAVGQLQLKLFELASKGPTGPKEIAEAMKVMTLAGMNASDVYSNIKPVLNFAVGGDTTIAKAADVITSVGKAYKLAGNDYERVADIISVTAAATKASVEDMGEAFKLASTVNAIYGVSLKDTALALGLLANVGVKGTSAGTAFRNMLNDLTGRSAQSIKVLKALGITLKDVLDQDGNLKLPEAMERLNESLTKLDGPNKLTALKKAFSERGDKGTVEWLDAITRAGENGGTVLSELRQKIEDYYGFASIAAARMSLTTENQLKTTMNAFSSSAAQAFGEVRPIIVDTANKLKDMFNSSEFKSGVQSFAIAIANATLFVVEHGRAIVTTVGFLMGAGGLAIALGGIARGFLAVKVAIEASTVALGFMRIAAIAFAATPVGLILTAIALAAGGVALAMGLMKDRSNEAAEAQKNLASNDAKAYLATLKEEETRLRNVVQARANNIDIMEVEMKAKNDLLKGSGTGEMSAAQAKMDAAQATLAKNGHNAFGRVKAEADFKAAQSEYEWAVKGRDKLIMQGNIAVENIKTYRRMADEIAERKAREEKRGKPGTGTATLPDTGKHPASGPRMYADELREVDDFYSKQKGLMERTLHDQLDIKKKLHEAKLLTDADYAEQSLNITKKYEGDIMSLAQKTVQDRAVLLEKERANLVKAYGQKNVDLGANGGITDAMIDGQKDSDIKSHLQAIRSFFHKYKMETQKGQTEIEDIKRESFKRMENSFLDYAKETIEAGKTFQKAMKDLDGANAKVDARASEGFERGGRTPWETAGLKARTAAVKEFADNIKQLDNDIDKLEKDRVTFQARFNGGDSDAGRYVGLIDQRLTEARGDRGKLKDGVNKLANKTQAQAEKEEYDKQFAKWRDDFRDGLSDAVSTAIFEGGAAGGKALRRTLEQQLIMKPFKIILDGVMNQVMGSGGSGGSGILGSMFKMFAGNVIGGAGAGAFTYGSSSAIPNFGAGFNAPGMATGGSPNTNSMYRVNETGMEMMSVGGKDYLLTGAQQGNIIPAGETNKGVNQTLHINIDSRADQAQVRAMVSQAVQAGNAKLVQDLKTQRVI